MKAVFKRILYTIPSLFMVIVLIFILVRVLPGNPAVMLAGDNASPETLAKVTQQLGLDQPYPVQFINYLKDLATGDLGYAWHTSNPVLTDFKNCLPASLELALFSISIAITIGVSLGIIAAVRKNSFMDHVCQIVSMIGSAIPGFWLGLVLIYVFYYKFNLLPAALGRIGILSSPPQYITGMYVLDSILTGDYALAWESFKQLILPAVTLSMCSMSILARMTRASVLETLSQDYVRTAKAKGLSRYVVVCKHALGNALIPILTVLGSQLGVLMGATVVTETIFSWPGIGSYITQSILLNDYAAVQAFALISAIIYIVINLILDILYSVVDPRIAIRY